MKIYDYLFYKTFLLSQRSKNFEDVPALGGLLFVAACVMFNIYTFFGCLDIYGFKTGIVFKKEYKIIFSFSLVLCLLFYYLYNDRYKRIIEKFEIKKKGISMHPLFVIIIYYGISFCMLLLVGMYKHKVWLFAN